MVMLTGIQASSLRVRRRKPSWEWKISVWLPAWRRRLTALAGEAEPVGRRLGEQLVARQTGQPLGHGVDGEQPVGVRIEQEQGVARFLEQRPPQTPDLVLFRVHGALRSGPPTWRGRTRKGGAAASPPSFQLYVMPESPPGLSRPYARRKGGFGARRVNLLIDCTGLFRSSPILSARSRRKKVRLAERRADRDIDRVKLRDRPETRFTVSRDAPAERFAPALRWRVAANRGSCRKGT